MTMSAKIRVHRVAVIPGDGIGVEVTAAAVEILKRVEELDGTFQLQFTTFDWSSERYLRLGYYIPDDGLRSLQEFDSILLGAVGSPSMFSSSLDCLDI
jgi:isocitrate/isopropylmalate dehydrogenase